MDEEEKDFKFLSKAEFSSLNADAKAVYLLNASRAIAAMTLELQKDIERRGKGSDDN